MIFIIDGLEWFGLLKKIAFLLLIVSIFISFSTLSKGYAEGNKAHDLAKTLLPFLHETEKQNDANHKEQAHTYFTSYKTQWFKVKNEIRKDSAEGYSEMEAKTALLSISLLNENQKESKKNITALVNTIKDYSNGTLNTDPNKIEKKSLSSYIALLKTTKQSFSTKDIQKGQTLVQQIKLEWLGVEGDVVSQSQSAYNNSERYLVLIEAYVQDENKLSKGVKTLDQMIVELEPLQKATYGIWDAALIPIREGVEALLVIGALLSVTKKANVTSGRRWIWGGTIMGLVISAAIGLLVSYFLKSISFGQNNFLINGWSGVIASLMLLYVSYWLHRNSNMKQWNNFIQGKTVKAISNGKMVSFAVLSFIAILREGMETAIFLIGMVNRMPIERFLAGILLGFGILVILGVVMLKLGAYLPLKPFFFVSSIIVFYLCIKFMGTGLHSLQLSGLLQSNVSEGMPSISFLGVYPSWYSTLPQLIILLLALGAVVYQKLNKRQLQSAGGSHS
jgi:high-affinity iron transporter